MSAPIPNKQLVPQTRLTYTVGPVASGARFTTIQGAITRAIADGANGIAPAVVLVFPGTYTENLTITGGGISVGGITAQAEVYLVGNISVTNDATGDNFYALSAMTLDGTLTVTGGSTGVRAFDIFNVAILNGGIAMTGTPTGQNLSLTSCNISGAAADVINAPNTLCFWRQSFISTTTISNRVAIVQALDALGCEFLGRVETSLRCVVSMCVARVTSQVAFTVNDLVGALITSVSVLRSGTTGSVVELVTGLLTVRDVTYQGTVNTPVLVTSGTVTYGNRADTRIGPYTFPTSGANIFTMPSADGVAGRALVTNGTGVLSLGLVTTPTTALTESATAALNWTTTHRYRLTMTGNVAISVTNPPGSCSLLLELVQDGTGGRIPTLPSSFRGDTSDEIPVQIAANAVTLWALSFNSTTGLYTVTAFSAGSAVATAVGV